MDDSAPQPAQDVFDLTKLPSLKEKKPPKFKNVDNFIKFKENYEKFVKNIESGDKSCINDMFLSKYGDKIKAKTDFGSLLQKAREYGYKDIENALLACSDKIEEMVISEIIKTLENNEKIGELIKSDEFNTLNECYPGLFYYGVADNSTLFWKDAKLTLEQKDRIEKTNNFFIKRREMLNSPEKKNKVIENFIDIDSKNGFEASQQICIEKKIGHNAQAFANSLLAVRGKISEALKDEFKLKFKINLHDNVIKKAFKTFAGKNRTKICIWEREGNFFSPPSPRGPIISAPEGEDLWMQISGYTATFSGFDQCRMKPTSDHRSFHDYYEEFINNIRKLALHLKDEGFSQIASYILQVHGCYTNAYGKFTDFFMQLMSKEYREKFETLVQKFENPEEMKELFKNMREMSISRDYFKKALTVQEVEDAISDNCVIASAPTPANSVATAPSIIINNYFGGQ